MLVELASFDVHHGPVGLAASPQAFTSARSSACARARAAVRDEPLDDVGVARTTAERESGADREAGEGERRDGRDAHRLSAASGAVDSRTTSFVESSIRIASTRWPSMMRISRLTPMRPISASGWRTEVSCGVTITACVVSSKPTTRGRRGPRGPRLRAACSAPIATLSLNPKIAVGGSGSDEQLLAPPPCRAECASRSRRPAPGRAGSPRRRARRGSRAGAPRSRTSRERRRSRRSGGGRARAGARWPASLRRRASPRRTRSPSGGESRGSTITNGNPWRCSIRSSSADSSGSIRIAPSVVPRIRRSSSETSRSCSCSVGASTMRMSLSYSASAAPLRIGPK